MLLSGVALTVLLIFLVFIFGSQKNGPVHELLFETAAPVQKFVTGTTSSLQSLKQEYIDLLTVREDKKRLVRELQKYKVIAYQNREAVATNTRLKKLLDLKNYIELPTVAAQIVGKDPSLWYRSVVIDKGSNDGVLKGFPVLTGDGIVGQIYSTSPHFSKVLLAIAPSSALDVLIQESRTRGILKGTGELTYRLEYVLKTVEVSKGDHVVTAGYGGAFPTGVPVGIITKVEKKRRGMFLDIEVTPAVNFKTLENLLVIELEQQGVN